MPTPVRAMVDQDQFRRDVKIVNSPKRLGRGGRARLARVKINHHAVIKGRVIWRPRASSIVRLCVRS